MTQESYVDSRGAEMPFMTFSRALEIVHELALGNQPDAHDIPPGEDGLLFLQSWQQAALDTLGDFIVNYQEGIDSLARLKQAGDWPDTTWTAGRTLDPAKPGNAIRISLDLAEQNALDPKDADGIDLAEQVDEQQQAFDLTRDFLGLHGDEIDRIVTIDISSL